MLIPITTLMILVVLVLLVADMRGAVLRIMDDLHILTNLAANYLRQRVPPDENLPK